MPLHMQLSQRSAVKSLCFYKVDRMLILFSAGRCFQCAPPRAPPTCSITPAPSVRLNRNRLLMGSPLPLTAFSTSLASTPPRTDARARGREFPFQIYRWLNTLCQQVTLDGKSTTCQ